MSWRAAARKHSARRSETTRAATERGEQTDRHLPLKRLGRVGRVRSTAFASFLVGNSQTDSTVNRRTDPQIERSPRSKRSSPRCASPNRAAPPTRATRRPAHLKRLGAVQAQARRPGSTHTRRAYLRDPTLKVATHHAKCNPSLLSRFVPRISSLLSVVSVHRTVLSRKHWQSNGVARKSV